MSDPTTTTTVEDLRALATEYCDLLDMQFEDQQVQRTAFLESLQLSLARLYAAALSLPEMEPVTEQSASGLSYPEWYRMNEKLKPLLPRDTFWEVFDPCWDGPPNVVKFSLADALSDVCSGLREGMVALDGGAAPESAAWAWRFGFTTHWGHHVLDALVALDCLPS